MSNTDAFGRYMRDCGLEPPVRIVADGKIHRFHIKGDKPGSENGWYVLHQAGYGAFGSWRRGTKETWISKKKADMSAKEKEAFDTEIVEIMRRQEEERKRKHAKCRKEANDRWKSYPSKGKKKHAYTLKKGIEPYGARINEDGNLVIPLKNINGKILGLQSISPDGEKKFLPGTPKKNNFFPIGEDPDNTETIIVCEGWATGCSLHEATGFPVLVAFDAGNLKPVAETWRDKFPKQKIIIAGDDDHATEGNPGRIKATEAAKAVKGIPAFPAFKNATGKTDFNDMHQEQGLDSVKNIIDEACSKEPTDNDFEDQWSAPILFGDIETPDIPTSVLPKRLDQFCAAVAGNTQTPTALPIMMTLAAVSTCLQKRFEVAPFNDYYSEPLNIYTLVGSDPGTRKTAVINSSTAPLAQWEKEKASELSEKAAKVRHEREMVVKSIESIKSRASKPDTTNEERQEALAEVKRLEKSMPDEIVLPRLWTGDVTAEKLQNFMAENGERMAVLSDEGGIFEVMSGLYTGGQANINVFLQSHAGSPVRVERQGRSVMMNKPALTFGLAIQPDVISNLSSGNKARFRGNGMLARLLYCIPKSTVGERDVTKRQPIPENIKRNYHILIFRLLSIRPRYDEFGQERPRILTLAPDALERWESFSQYIESKQGQYGELHSIRDWTSKLPGAALRIAGLCHVAEHGRKDKVINLTTMKRALKLAKLLIVHAKAAFGLMGNDMAITDAKIVLQWILDNGTSTFRRSELHKALHGRFLRVDRLVSALKVLTERQIISEPQTRPTGRRPEISYLVNPLVLSRHGKGKL